MDKMSLSCHALYLQVKVDNDKNSTKFKEDDEHHYKFLCNIEKKKDDCVLELEVNEGWLKAHN